ncbi:MAG: anti-sigma factor, partial [Solirubrobacterales bacterium]
LAAGAGGYTIATFSDDDARPTVVTARATAPGGGANATLTRSGDAGVLRVEGLPVQRGGKVYEVWLKRGEQLEPSALFVVDDDGRGQTAIDDGLDGATDLMVTLEPPGGSELPSSPVLLSARL